MNIRTLVSTPDPHPEDDPEVQLLGMMLQDPEVVVAAARHTYPEDFQDPRHAIIFVAALAVAAMGKPVTPGNVAVHLARRGRAKEVGGLDYLWWIGAVAIPLRKMPPEDRPLAARGILPRRDTSTG
ncbi:DnaB-like helicase N-terminal domain-containing protein [Streptomyces sp. NPDC046866]|uniref:DnaB-like helicase N-terminal domain-containing protein n=1 Tax=Streptomyces sp. NPDC046866 TaxID=3154921 RepID=UPI003453CBA4